jgi:hypothetical protein
MFSCISNNPKFDPPRIYPYLGVTNLDKVVLFTGPNTGTQLVGGQINGVDMGHTCNTWREEDFNILPRESIIILSND